MAFKVEIVNISENADNILLTNNLTIELVKIRYNWLLNANVRNAVVGEDKNGLVWYMGEWLCGDWEGGTWYSGIWHNGNWKKGIWHSYSLDKAMILFNKFIILDKNETYSEFRNGKWYQGTWYDGTFGYDQNISGYTNLSQNQMIGTNGILTKMSINTAHWINGKFYNGIFKNSVWLDGDFYNGSMSKSYWANGRFHQGTFERYNWYNGTWYGGDFLEGTWHYGKFLQVKSNVPSRFGINTSNDTEQLSPPISIWMAGNFYGGEFHSGLNEDGSGNTLSSINHNMSHWLGGNFNNGNWYGGSFRGGYFNNGNWYGGVFNSYYGNFDTGGTATWVNGKWYNGLWICGNWRGGHFYGGMWLDGKYENGYLSNDLSENVITPVSPIPSSVPVVKTIGYEKLKKDSVTCSGNLLSTGGIDAILYERGIYYTTISGLTTPTPGSTLTGSTYPVGLNRKMASNGIGNYSVNITGLGNNTKYYYGAYSRNGVGIVYGEEKTFTTLTGTTFSVEIIDIVPNVTKALVKCQALNFDDNPQYMGVCFSESNNPLTGTSETWYFAPAGTGPYQIDITGLTIDTTYYFKAFAINMDNDIVYSSIKSTNTGNYSVPTLTITNVTASQTTISCKVLITPNGTITDKGVCWRTSQFSSYPPDPLAISLSHTTDVTTTSDGFVCVITGYTVTLTPGTTYYILAFAKNSEVPASYGFSCYAQTPIQIGYPISTLQNATAPTGVSIGALTSIVT